jgi:hypothetical protein
MLLISVANGFTIKALDYRCTVKPLFAATNSVGKTNVDRREALSSLIIAGGALVGGTLTYSESRNDNTRTLGSVNEALNLIESECDRRFLHGVVASDYSFMYSELPANTKLSRLPVIFSSKTFANLVGTSPDFQPLEKDMQGRPVKPSNARIAFTSPTRLSKAASVWPLGENVHFAWSEDGEALEKSAGKMVVDGIDCGRMALEDALERKNVEILVRADRYLMLPVSLEADLLAGLKSTFII